MLHIIMYARVVELVDTLVLGTSASRREGSSPFSRTKIDFQLTIINNKGSFNRLNTVNT